MTVPGSSPKSAPPPSARCEPFLVNSLLPGPLTCTPAASVTGAAAGCEPFSAFPLIPGPSTHPARPSAASTSARCEPIPAFPLLPETPTCLAWPSAMSAPARCEPFSANRLTPASCDSGSRPGTMAAGAREQAASCDAFVLSRRLPAPDAPLSNRQKTSCITLGNLFGQYSFSHQSCATGTLLLQKEIYPQKPLPNLRQFIFCRLLRSCFDLC